jgi:uncharacterized membrane protein
MTVIDPGIVGSAILLVAIGYAIVIVFLDETKVSEGKPEKKD